MALFINPKKINNTNNISGDDETDEYEGYDEYDIELGRHKRKPDAEQPETGNPNVRRKHRIITETEEEEPVKSPLQPIGTLKAVRQRTHPKVRMSTDISKDLHTRLRIHAIRTSQSIIQIIEAWIETYCPE